MHCFDISDIEDIIVSSIIVVTGCFLKQIDSCNTIMKDIITIYVLLSFIKRRLGTKMQR